MNCAGCGHQNRDRARFCRSCGEVLGQRCARCSAECPPGASFCDCCGLPVAEKRSATERRERPAYTPNHLREEILTSQRAIEGEHKNVTVLFADILGSMELAGSVDAEEWHRIMDRFFAILSDGIHRFEGTINQFTGDGIMALFGAPVAHEDHAQRACWAALHLGEELRRYAEHLKHAHGLAFSVRMGINSGEVVVGTIGDDLRKDYTAQGPMVGLAARVEQLADPGTTYLSEHTAALVSGFFRLRDLGAFDLKGVREAVRVYELLGPGPMRTRLDVSRARGFSRFVGRADEMSALEAALERTIAGNGQVVGVVAEAGVGKSRLCFEFAERCRARGIMVREAHAAAHGKMIPFRPVLGMLRGFFGVNEHDGAAVVRQKIAGAVLLTDSELTEGLPILFEFLGVPDHARPAPRLDPEARKRQLLGIVTRLIQALSQHEPVLLLLEDLHWMDSGSEAFLEHLVEVVTGTRILVLMNFRPDYHAEWMQKSYYHQLALPPLSDAATRELLDDLLGADPDVRHLARAIRERTGGNPFFIEEVVKSLVDSGNLESTKDAYRLATPVERLTVPATVQAVLASRIDRLEDHEKRVLQTAAVVGRSFSVRLLERVVDLPAAELGDAIRALTQAEFLYEEALFPIEIHAFKHPLTHEVAYGSQLAETRARTHAAVARALEELHPEKLDEQAALLAHHAESAGEVLEAARWHRRAAEWVGIRDPAAAHHHWRTVLALIGDAPDSAEKAELGLVARTWMVQLAWRLGFSREETRRIFETGVAIAERTANPCAIVCLTLGYAVYRGVSGDEEDEYRLACEAARRADQLQDPGLSLAARATIATSLEPLGRLAEGIEVANCAVEHPPDDPTVGAEHFWISPYTYLLGLRGLMLSLTGRTGEGARDLNRALELARESGEAEVITCLHAFQVQHACCTGDEVFALAHGQRAVELAEETGIPLMLADAYRALGAAQVLAGQWSEARAAAERALEIIQERRIMIGPRPQILLALAEATLGCGDAARARRLAREVVTSSQARHAELIELAGQLVLGRAALHSEGTAAADEIQSALSSAVNLVEKTNARSQRPGVHLVLSEVARFAGDELNRERQLREAQRLYDEMGATGHAERIARELG